MHKRETKWAWEEDMTKDGSEFSSQRWGDPRHDRTHWADKILCDRFYYFKGDASWGRYSRRISEIDQRLTTQI
jgi:hypothetical protein